MSVEVLREQKRQRTKTDENKTEKDEEEGKVKAEAELTDPTNYIDSESNACLLAKTAEAVLSQIFTFLNVKDHWKFSRTSIKMEKISKLPKSSPTQIDILSVTTPSLTPPYSEAVESAKADKADKADNVVKQVVKRLLNFRPVQLRLPFVIDPSWNLEQMTSLCELTIGYTLLYNENQQKPYVDADQFSWLSSLTRLTKLKMSAGDFASTSVSATLALPSSLTQLELFRANGGHCGVYLKFNVATLFQCQILQRLQVLKLPDNEYFDLGILEIGTIFPLLRELSFGYFDVRDRQRVSLEKLKSCSNLEALSIGIDAVQSIIEWESLALVPSLRRLTITLYPRLLPSNCFAGISQISQLTQLRIASHRQLVGRDISDDLRDLVPPTKPVLSNDSSTGASTSAIRLTSLRVGKEFKLRDGEFLSRLSTLEELEIPNLKNGISPHLPRLRTLHIDADKRIGGTVAMLEHYKDQVSEVIYKCSTKVCVPATEHHVECFLKMPKLTTLKVTIQAFVAFFKQRLPATVKVETCQFE